MNPNQQNQQLDPNALALTKAIALQENGGKQPTQQDYLNIGKTGERGLYQFRQPTWNQYAGEILGNSNADPTPENQNAVAYGKVKQWLDKGYSPTQVASMWNAGEGNPQAAESGLSGATSTGAVYNVKNYASNVLNYYQDQLNQPAKQPTQPIQPSDQKTGQEGLLPSIFRGITQPVATLLARPVQAVARLAGATPEQINAASAQVPFFGQGGRLDIPQTGSDILKDVGRAAQTVSLGLPVGTLPKAIGMGALMGAGAGLEQSPTLGSAVSGGLTGSAFGLFGGLFSKALSSLPTSLTSSAFKGMNEEQIAQTLATKSMGSKASLLAQSEKAVSDLGSQLGNILKGGVYRNVTVSAENVLSKLADNPRISQYLTDTGLTLDEIGSKIQKIVPLKSNLVNKFFDEGLTLPDLHRLNSALGNATFKTVFDEPAIKAGKDLASVIYHGTSDYIKGLAPETIPIFDQLSKEYGVRTVLEKLAKKKAGGLIQWRDIMPFLAGTTVGGPLAGLGGVVAERLSQSPTAQFAAAKTTQAIGKGLIPIASRAGLLAPLANQ